MEGSAAVDDEEEEGLMMGWEGPDEVDGTICFVESSIYEICNRLTKKCTVILYLYKL